MVKIKANVKLDMCSQVLPDWATHLEQVEVLSVEQASIG